MMFISREKIKKLAFRLLMMRGILTTSPIRPIDDGVRIVSMVSHMDLIMYLIAVKSLHSFLGTGRPVVIDDGTLTRGDRQILERHLAPEIVGVRDIGCGRCPQGGTWERLLLILDYLRDSYVIQLDSDTVTLNSIPEVASCLRANRSFTLGTAMGRGIASMRDVCTQMQAFKSDHIQVNAEQMFCKLRDYGQLKYIRGCSGFAGFAKGSFTRSRVEEFSQEMEGNLGEAWFKWGSEQVTSNFVIANSPDSCALPFPKYMNYAPDRPYSDCSFVHFVGTDRFKRGVYISKAREAVRRLETSQSRSVKG
jgi:hypothetical protein